MDQCGEIIWEDVATRLFTCTKDQAAYVYNLDENFDSLKYKWRRLQDKEQYVKAEILIAERGGKKRTNEVTGWLNDAQNFEKEMKGILKYEAVRNNQCQCGNCYKNCVWWYKLGKKVVNMLRKVDDLLDQAKSMEIAHDPSPKLVNELPTGETVGLELMVEKVWKMSIEDDNVGIFGLFGMGGAGKTILMKRIHNEFVKRKNDFDLVLWTVVSRDCDINKIMNNIRMKLRIDDDSWNKSSEEEDRVGMIYRVLKEKKFVLMLDDLWEKLELDMVGIPFPNKESEKKSKVIFTTRYEDVCAKMQAQKKFKVECLSQPDAFELFKNKVGDDTLKCHTEIPMLAREMAEKCGGLPLALSRVGTAMAGVKSVKTWRLKNKDLGRKIDSNLSNVFHKLKLSYDNLPDEAHKKCFLYCALYPKDYEVCVEDLIYRWIGERLIGNDDDDESIYKTYEQGAEIISDLKLSCLLEECVVVVDDWRDRVKMHVVIRDMALWIARDQNKNIDKIVVQEEALTMSSGMNSERLNVVNTISVIMGNYSTEMDSEGWQVPACPNLITLSVRVEQQRSKEYQIHTNYTNLKSMKRLKVLDLSGNYFLRRVLSEISDYFINLEFLNLSRIRLSSKLSIEFKLMKNLRVFLMEDIDISNDRGVVIPIPLEVIENLKLLKVLRISTMLRSGFIEAIETYEIKFLEKLESLTKLEELGIQLTSYPSVQKLLSSTKLRGCFRQVKISLYESNDLLEITTKRSSIGKTLSRFESHWGEVENTIEPILKKERKNDSLKMSALLESFSKMEHLDSILLLGIHNLIEGSSSINDTCHLKMLRHVNIDMCDSITHLTWLRRAQLLEYLTVSNCGSIQYLVKEAKDEANFNDIFQNLTHIHLNNLPKLESIHMRALAFPFLKHIVVSSCPNLRKLPFNSCFAAKDNLISIWAESDWLNNLEWEIKDKTIQRLLYSKFMPLPIKFMPLPSSDNLET